MGAPFYMPDVPHGVAREGFCATCEETSDLDLARALHARRALEQALDHGTALLAALGLPRLALDVIDDGIAALDRMDAAEEDLEDDGSAEPVLGAPERHPGHHQDMDGGHHVGRARAPLGDQTTWACGNDRDLEGEHDGRENEAGYDLPEGDDERCGSDDVDHENSLGWTNSISQVGLAATLWHRGDELETTAIETHGKGFNRRCGPDDAEDGHDAEREDYDGTDDGEDISHFYGQSRPHPLTACERAGVRAIARHSAAMREAIHG